MSSVPSGYPDWQRVENWDSPQLADVEGTLGVGVSIGTFALDVSRYAFVSCLAQPGGGAVLVTMRWFIDSAGTNYVGQRRFVIHGGLSAAAQLHVKNMGPFVKVTFTGLGAAEVISAKVFVTNRPDDREFLPDQTLVVPYQAVTLNNNTNQAVWPIDYWSGPARLYMEPPAAGWFVDLFGFDVNGNTIKLDSYQLTASRQTVPIVTPSGAWQLLVTNLSGAAGTLRLSVTPSLTGST